MKENKGILTQKNIDLSASLDNGAKRLREYKKLQKEKELHHSIEKEIFEATLDYQGYQKALKAVQYNGASMRVIETVSNLVIDARTKRYELLKKQKAQNNQ